MARVDVDLNAVESGGSSRWASVISHPGSGGAALGASRELRGLDTQRLMGTLRAVMTDGSSDRVMVFTSAQAREGRTTVMISMARYLVETEQARVLMVDLSASRKLAARLGAAEADLQDLLSALASDPGAIVRALGPKGIIVARPAVAQLNDAAALLSPSAQALIRATFDYLLVEFPPFDEWPGVVTKSMLLGGLVLVVEAGRTRWPVIQQMREEFEAAGGKVLGVVLNKQRYRVPRWLDKWL